MKKFYKVLGMALITFTLIMQPVVTMASSSSRSSSISTKSSSSSTKSSIPKSSTSSSSSKSAVKSTPSTSGSTSVKSSGSTSNSAVKSTLPSNTSVTSRSLLGSTYKTGSTYSFHFGGTPYYYGYHPWYSPSWYSPFWYNPYYWGHPAPMVMTSGDYGVSGFIGFLILLLIGFVVYRILKARSRRW